MKRDMRTFLEEARWQPFKVTSRKSEWHGVESKILCSTSLTTNT